MRDRLAVTVLASFSLLLSACQSGMSEIFDMDGPDRGSAATAPAGSLPLGSWTRDSLHCAVDRCDRTYEIDVQEPGTLQVDVYAPVGSGLPDCELSLEDMDGEALSAQTSRIKAQRRLSYYTAESGTYRLRLASKGANKDLFDFEVVAELQRGSRKPSVPVARPRPVPKEKPAAKRPVVPVAKETELEQATLLPRAETEALPPEAAPVAEVVEAPPQPVWLTSEVLDVEETSGRPSAVMLEAGAPDGVSSGMRGELFEGDAVIGRIEIVDVYPTGSRAKILGGLSAPVSFDTYSRIELSPPDTAGE